MKYIVRQLAISSAERNTAGRMVNEVVREVALMRTPEGGEGARLLLSAGGAFRMSLWQRKRPRFGSMLGIQYLRKSKEASGIGAE